MKELQELKHNVDVLKNAAQRAQTESDKTFHEMLQAVERWKAEINQMIMANMQAAMSQADGYVERLEQEIMELQRRDAELRQILETEDNIHFLQNFPTLCVAPEAMVPKVLINPQFSFGEISKTATEMKENLDDICKKELSKISKTVSETPVYILLPRNGEKRLKDSQWFLVSCHHNPVGLTSLSPLTLSTNSDASNKHTERVRLTGTDADLSGLPGIAAFHDATVCMIAVSVNLVLSLPLNGYVMWLILRGVGGTLASDFFPLNLAVSEILFSLCSVFYVFHFTLKSLFCFEVFMFALGFVFTARPLVQGCISVECYVGVVHPVLYLQYKSLGYKVACSSVGSLFVLASCLYLLSESRKLHQSFVHLYLLGFDEWLHTAPPLPVQEQDVYLHQTTGAIQKLAAKKTGRKCHTSYRRTNISFRQDALNKRIRFGRFTSSSLHPLESKEGINLGKTFGQKSCFVIKTCYGADISPYSWVKIDSGKNTEAEILIPPYEEFKVTKIERRAEDKGLPCDVVYTVESTQRPVSIRNCAFFKPSLSHK
ncbi:NAD(P)(+)--arginine ADP-ribosyltransferase 1 [Oryzias melastigma]|uniref:NAD(P)(+)--arginine ADP-ribosyltransferase n=1 Tax=Oryzias melastigma TaxID=30732 RepID=A0A834FBA9_ORYME|nr:NAD(P)(+)--arginine ADP-ribosyltransferase 1 [Oryzias melastigma]